MFPTSTLSTPLAAGERPAVPAAATIAIAAAPRPRLRGLWAAPLTATAMLLLSLATAWPPTRTAAVSLSLATLPSAWETTMAPPVEHNAPPQPTFRSTTQGSLTSSFGSLLLRQTNVFAR